MEIDEEAEDVRYKSRWWLIRAPLLVVLLLSVAVGAMFGWRQFEQAAIDRHKTRGEAAFADRDYRQAVRDFSWLAQHEPANKQYGFRWAESLALAGDLPQARALMVELAPPDAIGYLPALTWLAADAVRQPDCPESVVATFATRLQHALDEHPHDNAVREALAALYMQRGNFAEADAVLGDHPELAPEAALGMARYQASHGQVQRALVLAAASLPLFRARASQGDPVAQLRWAQAASLCETPREVAAILEHGLDVHGPDPFALELASLHVQYAATLDRLSSGSLNARQSFAKARAILDRYQPPRCEMLYLHALVGLREYSQAETYLIAASERHPELHLELARLRRSFGDVRGARLSAQRGLTMIQTAVTEPTDRSVTQDLLLELTAEAAR